jgi:TolA-binding protein
MPRSDGYRKLYPTATIINCYNKFHDLVAKALLHAFLYYHRKDWKGSFGRISSAMAITNPMSEILDEIASTSKEMDTESLFQLHNEVREAHLKTGHIKEKADSAELRLQQMAAQLAEVREQVSALSSENTELKYQLNGLSKQPDWRLLTDIPTQTSTFARLKAVKKRSRKHLYRGTTTLFQH